MYGSCIVNQHNPLQKGFKNFIKFKATLPVPILFRWSPRFPRHDTSILLLSILSTSNSANDLFKLFKAHAFFISSAFFGLSFFVA